MNFDLEKQEYDNIKIPKELHTMVYRTIERDKRRRLLKRRKVVMKMAASVAAMLVLSLTVGVNSSYAFARTISKVPVVGPVAEVLTVRKYEAEKAADEEYQKELLAETITVEEEEEAVETIMPISEESQSGIITETVEEGPLTLETWRGQLSVEKLSGITELYHPDMEILYAETPEKLDTILLAQIPERDTYLYGYHHEGAKQGVALRIGDKLQYFGWTYMNDTRELPTMVYTDMNGDGEEELAVLLYNTVIAEVNPQTVVVEEEEATETEENSTEDVTEEASEAEAAKAETETTESTKAESTKTETTKTETTKTETTKTETTKTETVKAESTKAETTKAETTKEASAETASTTKETSEEKQPEAATENDTITVSDNNLPEETTEEAEEETVSGNDTDTQEPMAEPVRGELWVVNVQEEKLTATVLTENDFSSQIIHQLKVDYSEEDYALQLYLQEEPLGEPISLYLNKEETVSGNDITDSEEERKIYSKISLDSGVRYIVSDEVKLYFKLGVWFEDEKEMDTTLIPELMATIEYSGEIFNITGRQFREEEIKVC